MDRQDHSSDYPIFNLESLDSISHSEPPPHAGFDPTYRYDNRSGSMQPEESTPSTDILANPTNQLVVGSARQDSRLTGTSHCKPADLFPSQAAEARRLACPLFLADICTDKDPICNNIAGRHMNEVYDHLVDPNGPHNLFVEACTICKQVVLSPQEKIDHGDSFRRCTNVPFRRKGPQAVQAQWGALFRTLAPSIVEIPSAYIGGNSIQPRTSSPVIYATSRTVYGQGDTLPASNTLTPPQPLLGNRPEASTSSTLLPQRARSPYDSLTSPRPSSPSELMLAGTLQRGMPDDPHLQIQILKYLLIKERKSRMPLHEQDNAAAQVEAEISRRMQSQQPDSSLVSSPSSPAIISQSLVSSPTPWGRQAPDGVFYDSVWDLDARRNS